MSPITVENGQRNKFETNDWNGLQINRASQSQSPSLIKNIGWNSPCSETGVNNQIEEKVVRKIGSSILSIKTISSSKK